MPDEAAEMIVISILLSVLIQRASAHRYIMSKYLFETMLSCIEVIERDGVKAVRKTAAAYGVNSLSNECRILPTLTHANIVRSIEVGKQNEFLVMEYANGGDLVDMSNNKLLNWADKIQVALSVAQALSYLHDKRIIHADIKPENVLFFKDEKTKTFEVKLCDFGAAHVLLPWDKKVDAAEPITKVSPSGTQRYMASEQFDNMVITKTDTWVYGGLLYALLVGCGPWDVSPKYIRGTMPPVPRYLAGAPQWLITIMATCFQPDPYKRPSMDEIIAAIKSNS